jgi:GTP-binding protein Era
MTATTHRSGFVAVIGRPNVGKSTLVNALVGHKISIVTSKPHTTRHAILGVLTEAEFQIIFIDTPGLASRSGKLMNRAMNKAVVGAVEGADIIFFVIEAGKWSAADADALQLISKSKLPCILIVNKIDRIRPKTKLLPFLQTMSARHEFVEIFPVSAINEVNLDRLKDVLVTNLPEQEALYAAEMLTNRGVRFRVAEILREKLMQNLHQEVPYGLGVEINELEEDESGRLHIDATIWVDRESHKGIVVGKGGEGIKKIGSAARQEMQEILDQAVHLESRVKLKKNWSDNAQALREMGYDGEV